MGNIPCSVCGEPWGAYGVTGGDMLPWEAALFRKGAGCPGCQGEADPNEDGGVRREHPHLEEHLRGRVIDGGFDDDVDPVGDVAGARPPWVKPPDRVLWTCHDCETRHMWDVDYPLNERDIGVAAYFEGGGTSRRWRDPRGEPIELEGLTLCSNCVSTCPRCVEYVRGEDSVLRDGDYSNAWHPECADEDREESHVELVIDTMSSLVRSMGELTPWAETPGKGERAVREHFGWYPDERSPNDADLLAYLREHNMIIYDVDYDDAEEE